MAEATTDIPSEDLYTEGILFLCGNLGFQPVALLHGTLSFRNGY